MIKKYQKLPVTAAAEVVEAAKFTGPESHMEMTRAWSGFSARHYVIANELEVRINPTRSRKTVSLVPGDYVIRRKDGTYEKLSAVDFEAAYEEVNQPDQTLYFQ